MPLENNMIVGGVYLHRSSKWIIKVVQVQAQRGRGSSGIFVLGEVLRTYQDPEAKFTRVIEDNFVIYEPGTYGVRAEDYPFLPQYVGKKMWWYTDPEDSYKLIETECPHCKKEVIPDLLGLCPECTWVMKGV